MNYRHGHSRAFAQSKTYQCWRNMLTRCYNKNSTHYEEYGGRGIGVSVQWVDFSNFLADMGERPDGLTIERIDNNGHYEPGNVRWATQLEQARNRRSVRHLSFDGKTLTLPEWQEVLGIDRKTLWARIKRGWPVERVLGEAKS